MIKYSNMTEKRIIMLLMYAAPPKRMARKCGWRSTRLAMKKLDYSYRSRSDFYRID